MKDTNIREGIPIQTGVAVSSGIARSDDPRRDDVHIGVDRLIGLHPGGRPP